MSRRDGGTGPRRKSVKLRQARRHKPSSQRWLQRQLNDPFVAQAQRLGYRSRAAFKLIQLDERFGLLKPGITVIDLGAAPGGWTQVATKAVGSVEGKGHVIAIDISEMDPVAGAIVLQKDFLDDDAPALIRAELPEGGGVDLVLSDMAAPATGHARTDHLKIMALCETAAMFASEVLRPGGAFVCKVLAGGAETDLLAALKRDFERVQHAKPAASRSDSAELYLVARGFRGHTPAQI